MTELRNQLKVQEQAMQASQATRAEAAEAQGLWIQLSAVGEAAQAAANTLSLAEQAVQAAPGRARSFVLRAGKDTARVAPTSECCAPTAAIKKIM